MALFFLSAESYSGDYYVRGSLSNGELGSNISNPEGEGYIKTKSYIKPTFYNKPLRCSIKNKINNITSGNFSMYMRTFDTKNSILSYRVINLPIRNGWQDYYMTLTSSTSRKAKSVICGIRLSGAGTVHTGGYNIY